MTAQTSIAAALRSLRAGEPAQALRELTAAIAIEPDSPVLHNALGSVLAAQGRTADAAQAFERAIALRADYPEALSNFGCLLLDDLQPRAALEVFRRAVALERVLPQAQLGLGRALCLLGEPTMAQAHFEQACALAPSQPSIHSQRCYASLFDPDADAQRVAAIHRAYETSLTTRPDASLHNSRALDRKLVVGYLSADFREHSVASFFEPVLVAHDRRSFVINLYSDVMRADDTTARLRQLADSYVSIAGVSDDAVAARIRTDRVDVLIDLAGHMQPNRLPLIARRPAPVLFSYLGYPGSTGVRAFDAHLTDGWADPPSPDDVPAAQVRIAGGYFAYGPPADAPDVAALPSACGAPITFGSMNDALKLNAHVLACWAEILERTPGSRLLLKARAFASSDVRARTSAAFGSHAARVELLPATATRREHLLQYARIDVALDTFPYAGATTTCEALYMGVPVISPAGDRHASRLGVSVLSAAGLSRLIAASRGEYVELALRCARDVTMLAGLRGTLRDQLRASSLLDGRRVAAAIEQASREYFARWISARS